MRTELPSRLGRLFRRALAGTVGGAAAHRTGSGTGAAGDRQAETH